MKRRTETKLIDNQDKSAWCEEGARFEVEFVATYPQLGFVLNPQRRFDKYAPDLIHRLTGRRADLKTRDSPWRHSDRMFGIPPQWAVSFNRNKRERYAKLYPEITVLFWRRYPGMAELVMYCSFAMLDIYCNECHLHEYQDRVDEDGNATHSYILDLRNPLFFQLIPKTRVAIRQGGVGDIK